MNRLVVRETSAGLGAYLIDKVADARLRGVVVGYDGRHRSDEFARDVASVLAGQGIRVHLFDFLVPTPVCSFVVRALTAAAGVMVTASHNPPQYNGYKVFWGDGSQIVPPHDAGIARAIEGAAESELPWCALPQARERGLLEPVGDEMVRRYLDGVAGLSIHPRCDARATLGIAYTPMHGVGATLAEQALARAGFLTVRTVASQRQPDGDFPTLAFPNPEEPGAMDEVLALAREMNAELACANDPDADRFAVAVRRDDGSHRMLTGDQIGILLGKDVLDQAPPRAVVGSTLVSSRLLGVMARANGADYFETLTGLKWIAQAAAEHQARGATFVFGYEESIGYMIGDLVRDKDGISALVAFAEVAAACAEKGLTVWNQLEAIYREHGLYLTRLSTRWLDGDRQGPPVGEQLRRRPPNAIAGLRVESTLDVASGRRTFRDGGEEVVSLPASDVLVYTLEGDTRIIVRPSGTEPKLKCYYEIHDTMAAGESFWQADARGQAALDMLVTRHQEELASMSS